MIKIVPGQFALGSRNHILLDFGPQSYQFDVHYNGSMTGEQALQLLQANSIFRSNETTASFGSFVSVPIINQPNAAILSTEAVAKRVTVVDDDKIAIRHMTYLCMSWDHRLLDGSDAMRFLARLKENLETWDFSREVVQP